MSCIYLSLSYPNPCNLASYLVLCFCSSTSAHATLAKHQMVNTASDAEDSGINNFVPEAHLLYSLSTEQRIVWQAQILQTTAEHMAKLQEIVSVQASILKSNNGVSIVNHQENPSTPSLPPFNKGKLVAMQQQVLEGVTQQKNSHQSQEKDQIGSLKRPLKRQVVKALKNMKSNEGISGKPLGLPRVLFGHSKVHLEPTDSCRHYLLTENALNKFLLRRIWPPPILPSWVLRSSLPLGISSLLSKFWRQCCYSLFYKG